MDHEFVGNLRCDSGGNRQIGPVFGEDGEPRGSERGVPVG